MFLLNVGSLKRLAALMASTAVTAPVLAGWTGNHPEGVNAIQFSPDGLYLATGGRNNEAYLWDAMAGGPPIRAFIGHTADVNGVGFSADGSRLLTGSQDKTASLWDVPTGIATTTLSGHTRDVYGVDWSHSTNRIATASFDALAKTWNPGTGAVLQTMSGHTDWAQQAQFSPDGSRLYTCAWDGTIREWNAVDGVLLVTREPDPGKGFDSRVADIDVSPDGTMLVAGTWSGQVSLWSLPGLLPVLAKDGAHVGHVTAVEFNPTSSFVASGSVHDGAVRFWRVSNGELAHELTAIGPVQCIAFSAENGLLAVGMDDGTVWVDANPVGYFQVPPESYQVTAGLLVDGGLNELLSSDDHRMVILQLPPVLITRPSVGLEVRGTSPWQSPETLSFTFEGQTSGLPASRIRQEIWMYNFQQARWDRLDSRPGSSTDLQVTVSVSTEAHQYVNPTNRMVKAQVWFFDEGVVTANWAGKIDQVRWEIGR